MATPNVTRKQNCQITTGHTRTQTKKHQNQHPTSNKLKQVQTAKPLNLKTPPIQKTTQTKNNQIPVLQQTKYHTSKTKNQNYENTKLQKWQI